MELPERIESRIDRSGECWIWTGYRTRDGYGQTTVGGRKVGAHRAVYELLVGPIPRGKQLDHVRERGCTSRACCRPDHLEPVTAAENIRRGYGRSSGQAPTCPEGHPYTDAVDWRGYRVCRPCRAARSRAYLDRQ